MSDVDIAIADGRLRFTVGDTVAGVVHLTVPKDLANNSVMVSFHCCGEVKWIEYPGTPYYLNGHVYFDQIAFHDEAAKCLEKDIKEELTTDGKKLHIPFSFVIPDDKRLPSTMISNHGFIQYFVRVTIPLPGKESTPARFIKEIIVQSPITDNLLITVGGSAEKSVLLQGGQNVSMHASLGRKGFYPGETITVHVSVKNGTKSAVVTPRVTLHQVQIFMCGSRHKTIETTIGEATLGTAVQPGGDVEELLSLVVPADESLTIKSSVISVKYFVHCTLDIPLSIDLHTNLSVIITSRDVIEAAAADRKVQPSIKAV